MKGLVVNSKPFAFTERVDEVSIMLKHARDGVQKLIDLVVLAGVVLLLAIFALGTFVLSDPAEMIELLFWTTPSAYLFCFWSAIFLILFFIYRRLEARREHAVLPTLEPDAAAALAPTDLSHGHNIRQFMDDEAVKSVEQGFETAHKFKHGSVDALHLFIGSLTTREASIVFARLGLSFDTMRDAVVRRLASLPAAGGTTLGDNAQKILAQAMKSAIVHRRRHITPVELMIAAYDADEFLQELLYSKKIERQDFENVLQWIRINDEQRRRIKEFSRAASLKPKGPVNRAYTSVATPFLDSVSDDLTRAAAWGQLPMLVGRAQELTSVFRAIEGGNQSVVLVGLPGVGKDALISGIAEAMVEERVPEILQDKRLVKISLPHIIAGSSGTQAEAKLLQALREIAISGNIVTVITDIDQMIGQGLDLSAILSQELDRRYTFVIATTTPEGYASKVERSVLGQKLIKIDVQEPKQNEAIHILEAKIGSIEYKHNVVFTYEAVSRVVSLTDRYMHDRQLPEKAIEVAQEVALEVHKKKGDGARVVGEDVAAIISEKTRVPVTEVASEEKEKLLHLEERMHGRVVGQDEAVKAIAAALRRARADLRSQDRPIANFLFLGPTGVGKTELAKTVSEVYFGSEGAMLRFDMSEYQEQGSINRLIGAAGQGGLITEAVRKAPFSLLLLDELEKAHPDILNLFLQVMDDGRLTDGAGRTIDFTNVILIATSNAGAQYLQQAVRQNIPMEQIKENLIENELKGIYRPEFLNRFDGIIVFKPLGMEEVVQIAYLMISKVTERLKAKGITFRASDEAVYELAQKGFDPKFGARPLRRVIQEEVDNAVATVLLKGEVGRRDTLVLEAGGKIHVEKAAEL